MKILLKTQITNSEPSAKCTREQLGATKPICDVRPIGRISERSGSRKGNIEKSDPQYGKFLCFTFDSCITALTKNACRYEQATQEAFVVLISLTVVLFF
jgi:hypothetical protein